MIQEQKKKSIALSIMFALAVLVMLLISLSVAALVVLIFEWTGLLDPLEKFIPITYQVVILLVLICLIVGSALAFAAVRIPLRPINRLIEGLDRLAGGDFAARISFDGTLGNIGRISEIADSFNSLAEELSDTEMLRSDFINNFSHEFKTPIVSIAGFAKLIRRGGLSEAQKEEYLGIIEEESLRLSSMATNVLNLTKVENQKILSDVTRFNISELLRSSVLLLESAWSRKNIDFSLDFPEIYAFGNEEMLKQVFINIIDNAIKFSPAGGTVVIAPKELEKHIEVSVTNSGSYIAPEDRERIFGRFYQADTSHSGEGNGVGLAIVKLVTQLHGGSVSVDCAEDTTTFTVTIPKTQNNINR